METLSRWAWEDNLWYKKVQVFSVPFLGKDETFRVNLYDTTKEGDRKAFVEGEMVKLRVLSRGHARELELQI